MGLAREDRGGEDDVDDGDTEQAEAARPDVRGQETDAERGRQSRDARADAEDGVLGRRPRRDDAVRVRPAEEARACREDGPPAGREARLVVVKCPSSYVSATTSTPTTEA